MPYTELPNRYRRFAVGAVAAAAVAALGVSVLTQPAAAAAGQRGGATAPIPAVPTNVLIFPAEIAGAEGGADADGANRGAREAMEIITDAVRSKMARAGVGLYIYSRRLPSIQRAVAEGLKPEDAAGPGDDDTRARRLAEIVGASEFVVLSVENYKYDPQTRTATFTLSAFRRAVEDGAALGTVSEAATGVGPQDVSASRQEGSAVARAADVVAEQIVPSLFPMPKVVTKDKGAEKLSPREQRKRSRQ